MRLVGLFLFLLGLAAPALADTTTRARFDVRLGAVKLGELVLHGTTNATAYAARSRFGSTGVAGALARVRFDLQSKGRINGAGPEPDAYAEAIDTGRRSSDIRLSYSDGVPRLTGGDTGHEGPALDPARQRGTLDPLTALFFALQDQPGAGLCTLDAPVFDGARRSHIRLTGRVVTGAITACTGSFRRVSGYTERELARFRSFPVTVEYQPAGSVMRATRVEVQTIYGKVVLHRR